MPDPIKPGFVPKVALTTSRVVDKPFEVPGHMTDSAVATGGVIHVVVGKTNEAVRQGVDFLKPRGPAKLLTKVFDMVDKSVASSSAKADRNVNVFWKPFSEASAAVGQSVANPGASYYARKVGFPDPTDLELLAKLVHSKGWPVPEGEEPPPTPPANGGGEPAPAPPANGGGEEPAPAPAPAPAGGGEEPAPAPAPAGGGEEPAPAPAAGGEEPAPAPAPAAGGEEPAPAPAPAEGGGGESAPAPTEGAPAGSAPAPAPESAPAPAPESAPAPAPAPEAAPPAH